MIIDIGGGTTEIAIFAMGDMVISKSMRIAGDEMDEDIVNYVRNKYNLLIGERMAEEVKISMGSAFPLKEEQITTVRGRNLVSGLPEAVEISSVELRDALSNSVRAIIDMAREVLDETPPEIVSDLMELGVCLAGGGSQLRGLDERLSNDLRMRAWVAEDPMTCVARGAGLILEDLEQNRHYLTGLERTRG
jgi:rod shape-determining protein MreB